MLDHQLVWLYQISADSCLFSNYIADFSKLGLRCIFCPLLVFSPQIMSGLILF
jgi:hypothetical protein